MSPSLKRSVLHVRTLRRRLRPIDEVPPSCSAVSLLVSLPSCSTVSLLVYHLFFCLLAFVYHLVLLSPCLSVYHLVLFTIQEHFFS